MHTYTLLLSLVLLVIYEYMNICVYIYIYIYIYIYPTDCTHMCRVWQNTCSCINPKPHNCIQGPSTLFSGT